jgi:hypothetical protein
MRTEVNYHIECNYYCNGDDHAMIGWTEPCYTFEEMQSLLASIGIELLSIREAPETPRDRPSTPIDWEWISDQSFIPESHKVAKLMMVRFINPR